MSHDYVMGGAASHCHVVDSSFFVINIDLDTDTLTHCQSLQARNELSLSFSKVEVCPSVYY